MKLLSLAIANTIALATTLPLHAAENSMVELTYSASQIQCGAGSPLIVIGVDVYDNGELVAEDMRVNDSVLVSSVDNVTMEYSIVANGRGCKLAAPTELVVSEESDIPNLLGAYDQDSIATLLSELEDYEELFLVELGTTNQNSPYWDLQDLVITVNNEPDIQDTTEGEDVVVYAD